VSEILDIFGTAPNPSAERIANVKEILTRSTAMPAVTTDKPVAQGSIKYHRDILQGSDAWLECRRGILTASEMKHVITPSLKIADNDKCRAHVWEIAAQRITGHVEPSYISDDMLRGMDDEIEARNLYAKHYEPVEEVGFVTNSKWGFTIGASPDGIVGDDGGIEIKSRRQKFQIQTLVENVTEETIPADYVIQVQTCLLVTERKWWDFISYSGGLEMPAIRVYPNPVIHAAIIAAATAFEAKVQEKVDAYHAVKKTKARLIPTERRVEQEIMLSYGD